MFGSSKIKKHRFEINSQGYKLRGFILCPEGTGRFPAVIVSHGFASSTHDTKEYAMVFAEEGYVAVCFEWNAGEIPVAAIHPASAGHGLNLQAGDSTLVWFGLTWSLELYQQMNARLWRQGQEETVVIHPLIAKGTLDERVMAALEKKDCGQSALVDAVKARIGGGE